MFAKRLLMAPEILIKLPPDLGSQIREIRGIQVIQEDLICLIEDRRKIRCRHVVASEQVGPSCPRRGRGGVATSLRQSRVEPSPSCFWSEGGPGRVRRQGTHSSRELTSRKSTCRDAISWSIMTNRSARLDARADTRCDEELLITEDRALRLRLRCTGVLCCSSSEDVCIRLRRRSSKLHW